MDYIATLSPQGITVLYETYNIKSISLLQPVDIDNNPEPHYFVLITYTDDSKEQTVISHSTWDMWNQFIGGNNENK